MSTRGAMGGTAPGRCAKWPQNSSPLCPASPFAENEAEPGAAVSPARTRAAALGACWPVCPPSPSCRRLFLYHKQLCQTTHAHTAPRSRCACPCPVLLSCPPCASCDLTVQLWCWRVRDLGKQVTFGDQAGLLSPCRNSVPVTARVTPRRG